MTSRLLQLLMTVLLLMLLLGNAALAQQVQQHLSLRLYPGEHRLVGSAEYVIAPGPRSEWTLHLSPRADLLQVSCAGHPARYRFTSGQLRIDLPSAPKTVPLSIRYELKFAEHPPAQPAHSEDPSYGITASIQPAGTFLGAGTGWLPLAGKPQDLMLEIIGPEGYRAVTTGRFVDSQQDSGRTITRWRLSGVDRESALAAGYYQIRRRTDGVPVYAFFGADNLELADSYLKTAGQYLDFYQKKFGPYPFPQFVIAENFFPTGYGYPGWTLLGSSVIRLPFIVHTSLVHELAHCWWGNGVRPDRSQGNWSEGLATYVADYLVRERSSPAEARGYRLKILRDYATLADGGGALRDFQSRFDRRSQVIGYGKGAMVFHMIRTRIGDQAFWAGLREAARRYMFATASWEDLLHCFADQGFPTLVEDFRPWLVRKDIPELAFAQVKLTADKTVWTVKGFVEQRGKPWAHLQLDILLRCEGRDQTQHLALEGRQTPFVFTTRQRPLSLQGDPEVNLMRLLAPTELPATVNHLRAADPLTVFSCGAAAHDQRPLQVLLAALRKPGATVTGVAHLPRPLPQGTLLVYGRGCVDRLPVSPNAQATKLLAGLHHPNPDHSTLMVLKRADQADAVIGIFQPAPGDAAQAVARKIPHYGKYSYLDFNGPRNVQKMTWEADSSPLLICFPKAGG